MRFGLRLAIWRCWILRLKWEKRRPPYGLRHVAPVARDHVGSVDDYLGQVIVPEEDQHLGVMGTEWVRNIGADELDIGIAFCSFLFRVSQSS